MPTGLCLPSYLQNKKKCYSYIRWSSDKQSGGSKLARQLKTALEIAVEQDLELVEMIDSGISAFKGKNAKDGELGRFIDAVENTDKGVGDIYNSFPFVYLMGSSSFCIT